MSETFHLLLPQIVLAIAACALFLAGTTRLPRRFFGPATLAALLTAAAALSHVAGLTSARGGLPVVFNTPLSLGFQGLCLFLGSMFVMFAHASQAESETAGEFYGLLLVVLCGMLLVAVAQDLLLLFLSLELISIPTYVLLYLARRNTNSQEAAIKYFLLSVLSGAILLYGFALLYGLTGTTNLPLMRSILAMNYPLGSDGMPSGHSSLLGVIALLLIFSGLAYKLAAVPFHFYAPDVYQGTTAFNAGLLSIAPKAAGVIALIRIGSETVVGYEHVGAHITLILAAISMALGNCLAVVQTNVRRMLAYSGVAHAGYMLIGLSVGHWDAWHPTTQGAGFLSQLPGGIQATLLYLVTYCIPTAGLFGVLVYLTRRSGREIEHVDDLAGLGRTQPIMAAAAALFLFSLAGIPPLPGFWGKMSVIASCLGVHSGDGSGLTRTDPVYIGLAVLAMLTAAIGAVAYLRIIAMMYFSEPISVPQPAGGSGTWAAVIWSAVLAVALGLWPRPLYSYLTLVQIPKVPGTLAQNSSPVGAVVLHPPGGASRAAP